MRVRANPTIGLAAAILLASGGCGGGGGDGGAGGGPPQTLTLDVLATFTGGAGGPGPGLPTVEVGDVDTFLPDGMGGFTPFPLSTRCTWSFDVTQIPAGATVTSAVFSVGQILVTGIPFTDGHGNVVLDHVDLGPTFDPTDLAGGTLPTAAVTLSNSAALGVKSCDVTAQVAADLASGR